QRRHLDLALSTPASDPTRFVPPPTAASRGKNLCETRNSPRSPRPAARLPYAPCSAAALRIRRPGNLLAWLCSYPNDVRPLENSRAVFLLAQVPRKIPETE